jgi:hypothetical protein
MTMWAHPEWHLWAGAQPPPRPPGRHEQILSRVRHPSFVSGQLDELLRGLSHRQLRRLWRESARQLDSTIPDDVRLNIVLLREWLLDRFDAPEHGRRRDG